MRIVKRNVLLLISIVFFVVYVLKFRSGFEDSVSKTSEKHIDEKHIDDKHIDEKHIAEKHIAKEHVAENHTGNESSVSLHIDYISQFFSFYGICEISPKLQVSIDNNVSQNSLQQIQESLIQSHFPFCAECKYYSPNDSLISNKNVAVIKSSNVTVNLLHLPIMIHAPCIHSLALGNGLTRYFDLMSCAELAGELIIII